MLQNPFVTGPLNQVDIDILYVKRKEEDEVIDYLTFDSTVKDVTKKHTLYESRNFIAIGPKGYGKTTFINRLSEYILSDDYYDRVPVIIPQVKSPSLKELLGNIYMEYLKLKKDKSYEENTLENNFRNTRSYRAFSLEFLIHNLNRANLIVFIDNAHTLFKYDEILKFITATGYEKNIQWGLFMTPVAYYNWHSNKDSDGFFDRFNLIFTLTDMSFEQVKEMIQKRLAFRGLESSSMLEDVQINRIVNSLNGAPRPIIKTCKLLYDKSIKMGSDGKLYLEKLSDLDVANAIAVVKLGELDISGLDQDYKQILQVFMIKEGFATTKELLDSGLSRTTLHRKLNYLRQQGHIYPQTDEGGNEIVGKWELNPSTSAILAFGANGEFAKKYEDKD